MSDHLTMADLARIAEEWDSRPPVAAECRVGSRLVLDFIQHAVASAAPVGDLLPAAPMYGVPVVVDDTLRADCIQLRDRRGNVLTEVLVADVLARRVARNVARPFVRLNLPGS